MPDPIPFAEWTPDRSDRANAAGEAKGVISVAGQYAPFKDIVDYSGPQVFGNDSFTKVLLHFNGTDGSTTIIDDNAGGSAHTWTANGNAQIDTAQFAFGGASGLFDGTGDYVSTPDHADFVLGASDWTIDFRANVQVISGAQALACGQIDNAASAASGSFYVERTVANIMRIILFFGAAGSVFDTVTQFTNLINPGFHHFVFVRSGNTVLVFVDGILESSTAFNQTINDSANALSVGRAGEFAGSSWNGWIDEFRLNVGIARWTANFTPPTFEYGANNGAATQTICLGADTFYDSMTAPHIYMGDTTKLYHLESRVAVDRSIAGGYTVADDDTWQLAQFGDNVIAVADTENPQVHNMLTPAVAFANLGGGPPVSATSVARVNDFLFMGKAFTLHWSAFNNIADWTPSAATQAGNQALDQERGEILRIIGLDYAAIFQERAIRRAIYVGPPIIWDFGQDYVEKRRGCISRNAAVEFGRNIFYAADDGFYVFDGQQSVPIGYGKVDDYYVRKLNYAYRHKVAVGIDTINKLAVFGFPAGSATNISELLIYAIQDGRWTYDVIDLDFLFDSPVEPLTVDNFQLLFPSDNLDDPTITPDDIDSASFDDRRQLLAGVKLNSHRLGFFTGAPRAATIDTGEFEASPGRRGRVTEIWPMGDFAQAAVTASVGYRRALPGGTLAFTNPTNMNGAGFCPQQIDARFLRSRLQIGAGQNWRRAEGINYTARLSGSR